MNVVFIGSYNITEVLNGPEKVSKRIFTEYTRDNKSVFIGYFSDGNRFSILKKLFGLEEICTVNNSVVLRSGFIKLFMLLIKIKPCIVHIINYERFALICFLYKIFSGVKIIYNVHGIVKFENRDKKDAGLFYRLKDIICEYIFLKFSDKQVFLSEISLKTAKEFYCTNESKVSIIPNGIDREFHTQSNFRKTNYGNPLKLVFTGDIKNKWKGFESLTEALGKISFKFELYCTGSDNYINNPADKFPFVKIINRMNTEELAQFLTDKDVFISSSCYEQFSLAAVESMAAGLVPVVTEETGMSSFINSGFNGFRFSFSNESELTDILNLLNADRNRLNILSAEAVKIYEVISWDRVFEKYRLLYQ